MRSRRKDGFREERYQTAQRISKFREEQYRSGQAVNPTADEAIARADGHVPVFATSLPPPDREWIPQLYAELQSVAAVMRESGLPRARVKELLAQAGVEFRTRSQSA